MNEEKKQVLKMLQDGKVSIDEAMKLLDAIDEGKGGQSPSNRPGRMLRVRIDEEGKTKVNVNIPLSLAKWALKLIPGNAKQELVDQNIDLEEVISSITESTIGKIVDIQDDETKVEVFVE